jgi:hypothetical protein
MRNSVRSTSYKSKSVHPFKSVAEFEAALSAFTRLPALWRTRSVDYLLNAQSKKLRDRMIVLGVALAADHEMMFAREAEYEPGDGPKGTFADYVRNGLQAYKCSGDPVMRELRFLYGRSQCPNGECTFQPSEET